MAEVISLDLSSDDGDDICELQTSSKSTKVFKCLNPECRSTENLMRAEEKMKKYFGVSAYKKKTRICKICFSKAQTHRNSLITHLKSGCNVMDNKIALPKNTMILTDSESDKTDDEEWEDDSEYEYDIEQLSSNKTKGIDDMEELKNVLTEVMSDLKLTQQIENGKAAINQKLLTAEKEFGTLDDEYKTIENKIDTLRTKFYDAFSSEIRWKPSLEIGAPQDTNCEITEITEVMSEMPQLVSGVLLPPMGPLMRPVLKPTDYVYSMKHSSFAPWMSAVVLSIDKEDLTETFYWIQYDKSKDNSQVVLSQKVISGKKLAYFDECPTRVEVGVRIIAKFMEEDVTIEENGCWYVGIVAEIPTVANKYRYLIFFDDGYAQYVYHKDLRVVTQSATPSWEDVASESKEFIKDYLQRYPERPMVRLSAGNTIKTELNGRWYSAQVLEVDGSLAKMLFHIENRTEWIYRGSTRLYPLYNKKINIQTQSDQMKTPQRQFIRRRTVPSNRSGPVVEYINFQKDPEEEIKEVSKPVEKRAVAKKSTASRCTGNMSVALVHMKENLLLESKGDYQYLPIIGAPASFKPHQCNPKCLGTESANRKSNKYAPLYTPISYGWRRQVIKEKKRTRLRNFINYEAPCGRRMRSIEEIFRFLRLTQSSLQIDYFSFDIDIILEREWTPARQMYYVADITNHKEDMDISCVNSIDTNKPKSLIYSDVRLPSKNVGINLDPGFLTCCSCEDDCQDKERCECWQMTLEATRLTKNSYNPDAGYKHRRLHEQVLTGIFECNSECACSKSCLNRMVQFPIRQKLQLFKTARRGWGVRTLNDLPHGTFICVYVGRVLTEKEANEDGMTDGADDYYAEMDFIEIVENIKEGYESDVSDIEEDDDAPAFKRINKSSDMMFRGSSDKLPLYGREKSSRLLAKQLSGKNESDESEDSDYNGRRRQTFEPSTVNKHSLASKIQHKKLRDLFGADEDVFIMDAKVTGNIGRYLNHSCNPNVFVQNVFVDTHDPRFPSISFFAGTNIKAGSELTWDYNYEVDSVPGKIKYCYCQSPNCRGRLL